MTKAHTTSPSGTAAPDNFPHNPWQKPRTGWFGLRYVLNSSDASRQEGVVSMLAGLETVFAVAFYWWIAAIWDTHIHLVISLFVAPLLMLRSPESIALGLHGFMDDHYDFENWKSFSRMRRVAWLTLFALIGGGSSAYVLVTQAQLIFNGLEGLRMYLLFAGLGMAAVCLSIAIAGVGAGVVAGGVGGGAAGEEGRKAAALGASLGSVTGLWAIQLTGSLPGDVSTAATMTIGALAATAMIALAGAVPVVGMLIGIGVGAGASLGELTVVRTLVDTGRAALDGTQAGPGAIAVALAITGVGVNAVVLAGTITGAVIGGVVGAAIGTIAGAEAGTGIGTALRAIAFRLTSTIRRLPQGIARLPENWVESTLVIDMRTDAELLPGIRERRKILSLSGLMHAAKMQTSTLARYHTFYPLIVIFFLPSLLYRLYIKATAWFYWLLAYLLWRNPDKESDKAWLTSPWGNEARRFALIVLLLVGLAQFLIFLGLGADSWKLIHETVSTALAQLWPPGFHMQAPWLWLWCVNALACAWLLAWSSHFSHYFKEKTEYWLRPMERASFSFASRLHTLSILLLLMCGVATFTLHHYPDMLDFMPARQAKELRFFLGLTP